MPQKKEVHNKSTAARAQDKLHEKDRIIVIGASTGGVPALKRLITSLPDDFYTPIIIVWHMPADGAGLLPQLLNKCKEMHAANGIDNEPIRRNRIYTAPPDHHILVENDRIRITKGPKENRFRPAIDPLFRSAAFSFGRRAIGVVLTGGLDDGTSGLWTIKEFGGTAVVQDPAEAEASSMPESAMNAVATAHVAGMDEMGALLAKLAVEKINTENNHEMSADKKLVQDEVNAALLKQAMPGTMTYGDATQFACPECHGVLSAIQENNKTRFRCHTGHAYSAETLLIELNHKTEESLWQALRGFGETVLMLNQHGDALATLNKPKDAAVFFRKAIEAKENAVTVSDMLKKITPVIPGADEAGADTVTLKKSAVHIN